MSDRRDYFLPQSPLSLGEARSMTGQELRDLGLSQMAYFRPAFHEGMLLMTIHAADGTPIAIAEDERSALNVILEQEMLPFFVH